MENLPLSDSQKQTLNSIKVQLKQNNLATNLDRIDEVLNQLETSNNSTVKLANGGVSFFNKQKSKTRGLPTVEKSNKPLNEARAAFKELCKEFGYRQPSLRLANA